MENSMEMFRYLTGILEKEDKKNFICKLGALQGLVLALE